jgi:hypothetical protein
MRINGRGNKMVTKFDKIILEPIVVLRSDEAALYTVIDNRANTQKTFLGESAWSNAERYANDLLTEYQGSPFGERFML